MPELVLELADVRLRIVADDATALEPLGARWAAAGARSPIPTARDVIELELELDHHLASRPHGPDYPALTRRWGGDRLHVERADVVGTLELGGVPLRGRFRVAPHDRCIECAVRVALSVALPMRGALLLHASAVERAGRAQLFAGVSGAGKSTIAAMLDGAAGFSRLADELVVVAREGSGAWTLHVPALLGLPGLPIGAARPLTAVHLIAQAPVHHREALSPGAALRELMRHVVVYAVEPRTAALTLELVGQLVSEVPTGRLGFRKDPAVAQVLA